MHQLLGFNMIFYPYQISKIWFWCFKSFIHTLGTKITQFRF